MKAQALTWILVTGLLLDTGAFAAQPAGTAPAGVSGVDQTNPIRRINPNSRQGTVPTTPGRRAQVPVPPAMRTPSLENGGIGNGQRFPAPPPPRPSSPSERKP